MADRNTGRAVQGSGLIAASMVVSAMILNWGSSGSQPRFQIAGSANGVVRLDTDSGEMLACDLQQCRRIEEPLRTKTWGPLSVVFGKATTKVEQNVERKALPPPQKPVPNENSAAR